MWFAILGPLRVDGADGPIDLPAPKQRALLAALLLAHREDAVSAERLTDVLWGEAPPATAAKALQVHVSQLRRALGAGQPIVTLGGGYAVRLAPGELDLERFEALAERARRSRADGALQDAAAALREALALFRGPPLADAPLLGPAAAEADRLAGMRLAALEERLDVDLALGAHTAAIVELEALAAEHPYRERLHAQLMLALYRAGRQGDALAAFRRVRGALVEDLGLDPGRELQRLEAGILAQDPALDFAPEPAAAAPLRAATMSAPPPLPLPATTLLGREEDFATAAALLDEGDVRLLTLTGPGGIGKTRLALELAQRLGERFADGARFVALAALDDPARVMPAIAQALGAAESEDQGTFDALRTLLGDAEVLLVVDNFEQVLAAAPDLGRLLAAAPRATLVVTSRAALRIAGETVLAIAPLAPAPASDLFKRRARSLNPRLALGAEEETSVRRICERLDGLPLAIELAAARSPVLTPAAILERLEGRLDLLRAGPRDAPVRQQTLRATIDWSYDLLDPAQRALFAQLGVFAGGWTLDAAEAVCGPEALDGLATLVDHSLVVHAGDRFGMLETLREYALERLAESGEAEVTRRAHAQAFAALAAEANRGLHSPDVGTWLDRMHADRENGRAAIESSVREGDAATALRLCGGVWRYWVTRGNLTEGRALVAAALAAGDGPPELRLEALNSAGVLAAEQGDFAAAHGNFEETLALAREVGRPDRLASAYSNLGNLSLYDRDFATAIELYEQAAAIWRELGDDRGLSLMTQNLGITHSGAGDHERAVELLEESVVLARRAGDPQHLSSTLRSLVRVLPPGARDDAAVRPIIEEALALSRDLGDRPGVTECLETLASLVEPRTGAELIGAAEAAREAAGARRPSDEAAWVLDAKAALREALGDDGYATAVAAGRELTLAAAVARAGGSG